MCYGDQHEDAGVITWLQFYRVLSGYRGVTSTTSLLPSTLRISGLKTNSTFPFIALTGGPKEGCRKNVDSDKDDVEMWGKHDIPNSAKLIEKLKAQAKEIAAKKAASGPNESQIDIEKQRAEYQKKVEEYKKERQKMIEEQLKHLKDESQKRSETLKKLGAEEQLEKEKLALEQQKRAEALKKQKYG
jgi:hypothetical protein